MIKAPSSRCVLIFLLITLYPYPFLFAQDPPATIPDTEMRIVHSDILGQDLALFIRLPYTYQQKPDTSFRVLFFLDAMRNFPMVANMISIYDTEGLNSLEVVLVGIGYVTQSVAEYGIWRTRDLTPTYVPAQDSGNARLGRAYGLSTEARSGGAKNFLDCILRELIPFMESNYRVSSTDRGIGGYSLGGLFVMYTLFRHPEAFRYYLAGSPSLMYDNRVLFRYEDEYHVRHKDLEAKVFISAGSLEGEAMTSLAWKMAETLKSRKYPGLVVEYKNFPEETHASCYPSSIMRGLRYLYNIK